MKPILNNAPTNSSLQVTELPDHQEIQTRAYELYEQRGREDGHELEDWLQAEGEVSSTRRTQQQVRTIAA